MADKKEWEGEDYTAFRERVFGTPYEVFHDGPGVRGSMDRSPEEAEHSRRMLTEGVELQDHVAVVGWREFDPQAGLAILKPMVKTARDDQFIAELVKFLQKYDKRATRADKKAREALLNKVIERAGSYGSLHALMVSGGVPNRKLVESLLEKVASSDGYLVRYHAANALIKMAGKGEIGDENNRKIFKHVISSVEDGKELDNTEEDFIRYAKAAKMLKGMVLRRWPMIKLKTFFERS